MHMDAYAPHHDPPAQAQVIKTSTEYLTHHCLRRAVACPCRAAAAWCGGTRRLWGWLGLRGMWVWRSCLGSPTAWAPLVSLHFTWPTNHMHTVIHSWFFA